MFCKESKLKVKEFGLCGEALCVFGKKIIKSGGTYKKIILHMLIAGNFAVPAGTQRRTIKTVCLSLVVSMPGTVMVVISIMANRVLNYV